jgi:hypothetical protein
MDKTAIYAFIAGYRYGVVSSIAANGVPQSALVGITVTPEFEIVFDTVNTSRKYKNLTERRRARLLWDGVARRLSSMKELPRRRRERSWNAAKRLILQSGRMDWLE